MSKLVKLERNFDVTKALDETGTFEGFASRFGEVDNHNEVIVKGAFGKGLKQLAKEKRKLKMLWNHDRYEPIGTFLEADESDEGLWVRGKLTLGVQRADELHLLMQDGAIDSMSIGAFVVRDRTDPQTKRHEYLELQLREISPVTFPALDSARIATVKSLSGVGDLGELEAYLRDVGGFSISEAKTIVAKAKACTPQRDVDGAAKQLDLIREAITTLKG